MRGQRELIFVVVIALAACSSTATDSSPAETTSPAETSSPATATPTVPVVPTDAAPPASVDSATTLVPDTAIAETTPSIGLSPEPCALTSVASEGSITFVDGDRLMEWHPDGSTSCVTEVLPDETGPIRWSPSGEQVLLGGATVVDGSGRRPSGYFATNTHVGWSAPTGKALIAPSVNDGSLVWRSSTDAGNRLDVSFLTDTTAAAYHPAGRVIAASGVDESGQGGVYLATNRGEDRQALVTYDANTSTVDEVTWSMGGGYVYFLHHHDDGTEHLHYAGPSSPELATVVEGTTPLSNLTASLVDEAVAWADGEPGHQSTFVDVPGGVQRVEPGSQPSSTMPIGWLPGFKLVVLVRPRGVSDGPGELWLWDPSRLMTAPLDIVTDRAAVRVQRGPYAELSDIVIEQAPG